MTMFLDGNRLPAGIFSGPGSRHRLGEAIGKIGARRVLVIASASLLGAPHFRDELANAAGGAIAGIWPTSPAGASEAGIAAAAVEAVRLDVDAIVSIGGGAAHDIAKAVAVCAPAGRPIADFLIGAPAVADAERPLPVIAVPTTFSAAEMVAGGAVGLTAGGKAIYSHPLLQPRQVILDGELVATTPRAVLAASGLNAVHHCLEALAARGHQAMSDAWALFAFERLMRLLRALAPAAPPAGVYTYQALLEASSMSGLAYGISGLGVGHAICHSLAGRWDISHGNANAVILPHSVGFNLARVPERLSLASRAIGGADLAGSLAALCETLQTPRSLRDAGLREAQFDLIAADVLADSVTAGNPGAVSPDDVKSILAACW
jgi:alcohol dehydrogenase class IV